MSTAIAPIVGITLFLLGPILGSFLAATVMRQLTAQKTYPSRSVCDHCGHVLSWADLIPLLSFVWLRGKCRYCQHKLDQKIWWAEVMGAVFFIFFGLGIWQIWSSTDKDAWEKLLFLVIHFTVLTALFYLSVHDMFSFSIPAIFTYLIGIGAVVVNGLILLLRLIDPNQLTNLQLGTVENLLVGLVAAAAVYALILVTRQKGIGAGDVLIALLLGLMLGWPEIIGAFYVTVIIGSVVGLGLAAIKRKLRGLRVPLVPFMTLGYVIALFWGQQIFSFLFLWP